MAEESVDNRQTKTHSFSERHLLAIRELAVRAGHLNRSKVVQDAVIEKAERELGRDWEDNALTRKASAA